MTTDDVDHLISSWINELAQTDTKTWLREKLKLYRMQRNMTQKELAAKLGKTQSYIHKVESGDLALDVHDFIRYARHVRFNVLVAILVLGFAQNDDPPQL